MLRDDPTTLFREGGARDCWTCCPTLSLGECSEEMQPRRRSRSELGTQVRTCIFGLLSGFLLKKKTPKNRKR